LITEKSTGYLFFIPKRSPFIPGIVREIKDKPRILLQIYKKYLKETIFKISPKTFRQLTQFIQIKLLPIQNFKHRFVRLGKKQLPI
jgi:hypothetical protein